VNNTNNEKPFLSVDNLEVSFFTHAGEVKAVRGISYEIKQGEILGIVGESGSGKSVSTSALMRMVAAPGEVLAGKITFDGLDVLSLTEKEMEQIRGKDIGMIFQDPMTSLNPVYTVGNQIDEVLKKHTDLSREERKLRIIELFELVGINQPEKRMKQYPHEFSGGMRQRVVIAMALACNPKLLIADEPTTALDVTIQAQIIELLKELKEKIGMTIIFITHDLGVIAEICDKVAVMYGGTIVEQGTIEDIFYRPHHPYTMGLLKSIPRLNSTNTRLIPIEGAPIDLINPPAGCPFAPRCEQCMKVCMNNRPSTSVLSQTHSTACWLEYKKMLEKGAGNNAR